jgi:hypothetical protein
VDQPIARPVNREVMDKRRSLRNASDNLLDIHRCQRVCYRLGDPPAGGLLVAPELSAWGIRLYQEPVLAMLVQGSASGSAQPACSSSMEMPSGVRMKAMRPSRGGRLIVAPRAMKALHVS